MSDRQAGYSVMRVDGITIEGRHRQKLGDIEALAKSIEELDLLHPVVVTTEGRLVAGARRIAAFKQLGRVMIPVHIVNNMEDAKTLLTAERDENTCRLDMTPSEKVALGKALEELERPRAEARKAAMQAKNGTGKTGAGNLPAPEILGETRERVGAAVGMSGTIYQRAKAVVNATEHEDPEVRRVASAARDEMDRTGNVTGAFNLVAPLIGKAPNTPKPKPKPSSSAAKLTFGGSRRSAAEGLRRSIAAVCGFTDIFRMASAADANPNGREAKDWEKSLASLVSAVNRFRKLLKGYVNVEA